MSHTTAFIASANLQRQSPDGALKYVKLKNNTQETVQNTNSTIKAYIKNRKLS